MLPTIHVGKRSWIGLALLSGGIVGLALNAPAVQGATLLQYGLIAAATGLRLTAVMPTIKANLGSNSPTLAVMVDPFGNSEWPTLFCGSATTDLTGCKPFLQTGTLTITQTADDEVTQEACPFILGSRDLSVSQGLQLTFAASDAGDPGGDTFDVQSTAPVEMAVYFWEQDTVFGPRIADLTLNDLQGTATTAGGIVTEWNLTAAAVIDNFSSTGWQACAPGIAAPADGTSTQAEATFTPERLTYYVPVDLKPGSDDTLNVGSNGAIPVAVYSTSWFDATRIDPSTAEMDGAGVKVKGTSDDYLTEIEDVNGDGLPDMVLEFDGQADEPSSGLAVVRAQTYPLDALGGQTIAVEGSDDVTVVGQ